MHNSLSSLPIAAVDTNNFPCSKTDMTSFWTRLLVKEKRGNLHRTHEQIKLFKEIAGLRICSLYTRASKATKGLVKKNLVACVRGLKVSMFGALVQKRRWGKKRSTENHSLLPPGYKQYLSVYFLLVSKTVCCTRSPWSLVRRSRGENSSRCSATFLRQLCATFRRRTKSGWLWRHLSN